MQSNKSTITFCWRMFFLHRPAEGRTMSILLRSKSTLQHASGSCKAWSRAAPQRGGRGVGVVYPGRSHGDSLVVPGNDSNHGPKEGGNPGEW